MSYLEDYNSSNPLHMMYITRNISNPPGEGWGIGGMGLLLIIYSDMKTVSLVDKGLGSSWVRKKIKRDIYLDDIYDKVPIFRIDNIIFETKLKLNKLL